MMRTVCLALSMVLAAGAARAEVGVTDTEIKIGDITPLTGAASWIGQAFALGTRIAAAEINGQGGINGRKVSILVEDDAAVPARSFQAAKKLIEVDQVFALNGTSGSAPVLAMMPLIEQHKVPVVVSWGPNEMVYTPVRPTVFTFGASYSEAYYTMFRYIHQNREPKDAVYGALLEDNEFGNSIEAGYDRAVREFKLKDAIRLRYKRGQQDMSTEALQFQRAGVNVLANGSILVGAASLTKNLRGLGMQPVVGQVWSEIAPEAIRLHRASGLKYLVADYVADLSDPAGQDFLVTAKRFAKPDEIRTINRYTLVSYVAMKIFAEAARRCGADLTRTCYVDQLKMMKNFETNGLTAPISFDNAQQRSGSALKLFEVDPAEMTVRSLTDFLQN